MKLVQLKFIGLFKNDSDDNFVCVLGESDGAKRKLYIKINRDESYEILK